MHRLGDTYLNQIGNDQIPPFAQESWRFRGGARAVLCPDRILVVGPEAPFLIELPETCREMLVAIALGRCQARIPDERLSGLMAAGWLAWTAKEVDERHCEWLRQLDRPFEWMLPAGSGPLHEMAIEAHARRKLLDRTYLQGPCLPETAVRRALLVAEMLPGAKIMLLGDDDLMAPLLSRVGCRPFVADIDTVLLDIEQMLARQQGLTIETRAWNMASPIPLPMRGRFDAVMIDPLSQPPWLDVSLSRSISMLKPGGIIFLSVYDRADQDARRAFERMGLVELQRHNHFSHYIGYACEDFSAYSSDMFVLRVRSRSVPLVAADVPWGGNLQPAGELRAYMMDAAECDPVEGWPNAGVSICNLLTATFSEDSLHWSIHQCGEDRIHAFHGSRVAGRVLLRPVQRTVIIDLLAWSDVSLIEADVFCRQHLRAKRIARRDLLRNI